MIGAFVVALGVISDSIVFIRVNARRSPDDEHVT